jgi:hypothetical protein
MAFGVITLCLFAGLGVLVYKTAIETMFALGGAFDATRTASVRLDMDGRPFRITIDSSYWDVAAGDIEKGYVLSSSENDFQASREAAVKIQSVSGTTRIIRNADADYPSWDGTAWLFEAGRNAPAASGAAEAEPGSRTGRLYVRNLSGFQATIRVLGPSGSPIVDTSWTFAAYQGADNQAGSYLNLADKGPLAVSGDDRLEMTLKKGYMRILSLSRVAKWKQEGSWLFEIVPEYLAGEGNIFVKNSGDTPVRIWILGAGDLALYGQDPWSFDAKEGADRDKGLRLQYEDKNIVMTGREAVEIEVQELKTVFEGALEKIGAWKNGGWTIDMSKAWYSERGGEE